MTRILSPRSSTDPQQIVFQRRLPIVIGGLLVASLILLTRLALFQFPLDTQTTTYLNNLRDAAYTRTLQLAAARGGVYDRHGEALAINTLEYRIGISPILVADARRAAADLSSVLGINELELYTKLTSNRPWELLTSRTSAENAQRIRGLNIGGMTMEPVPRRSYPQGEVAAQMIGFVGGDLRGYYGVEGHYNGQLTGRVTSRLVSEIPFDAVTSAIEEERGSDVILTIDRDVQFIVESELNAAIARYSASGGTIIVMNPRTGDILAMASSPSFDPNNYFAITDERQLVNVAIGSQYEPGSVFKILTVAAGLETGSITPDFTYNDQGRIDFGGATIYNWDRRARGVVDTTEILVSSLNVGVATIAQRMGAQRFYMMLDKFSIGRPTGIDLEGEQAGTLITPGSPLWSEAQLGTTSFGQGVAVTPLQMLTSVAAIANDGLMMQPRVVHQLISRGEVTLAGSANLGRPISQTTARQVNEMMVAVVRDGLDDAASLPGYTIAGKTGTAEIPTPIGYEQRASITTFVGFLPADDPQIAILVKIDRPNEYWGAFVAAPTFRRLAERLVLMLEIPTDDVRRQLAAQGGSVNRIRR